MDSESLVIQASRKKTLFLIVIGFGFVALGLWFLSLDPAEIEAQRRFDNPAFIRGLGLATVTFFGLCVGAATWRLFSSKPGLALNSDGVTIYAATENTFIPWRGISGLSTYEVHRQRMLVLGLRNPDEYLERGGALRRWVARANFNLCGSPVVIASNTLKLDLKELHELFAHYFKRYGGGA